ncbi:uncharacterized protein LOC105428751 [Pogonomyrmex barbatus]|uniref:Uncharacterized protein LOC105428751 n=1 Tax=Pogonomyrmex barbatus TaxID=144034 RepID=A0A6I9WB17_9HYME|nr:uncharacterized protein LOC105428751 [Pogonomyrmex barbatus]
MIPTNIEMSFFDYFRNFFGIKRHTEPSTNGFGDHDLYRGNFRNPIWQSDEDDDDEDMNNFWYPKHNLPFNNPIFSNPFEMLFQTQMDNMLRNFVKEFNMNVKEFNNIFSQCESMELPFIEKYDNLRDKMLKLESDKFGIVDVPVESKVDTDLDGKISKEEFSKMWNKGNVETIKPSVPNIFGRSFRKEIIRRPDGTIEKKRMIRDTEGNEETIISKQIGDKKHVITIKKDKNGIETKSEDFINMDESELKDFIQKREVPIQNSHDSTSDHFPWEKFFGPNPKL